MAFGFECRSKILKQNVVQPTQRRPTKWDGHVLPGPNHYEVKELYCGEGFSHIKQAPKYSFGIRAWVNAKCPTIKAQLHNLRGIDQRGREHIPQGTIAEKCEPPGSKLVVPGPGAYSPKDLAQMKKPPAYTMRIAAKPPYQPWDMWTPSPNMYLPPIMKMKKSPAYSFIDKPKISFDNKLPGPGEYSPRTNFAVKSVPAFSLMGKPEEKRLRKSPAPNAHCEKSFFASAKRAPAQSFGIKHSQYLGEVPCYLQPTDLEILKKKSY